MTPSTSPSSVRSSERDFLSEVSYRLAFMLQIVGLFTSLAALFFLTKMIDPERQRVSTVIRPFDWMLVGLAFQFYFSTALSSFSNKIRSEQMTGTLEAMLVSPTPTSMVVFYSGSWPFTYGALRIALYLFFATVVFNVNLFTNVSSIAAVVVGAGLTLLSSISLGILSASFILYFKRGDPINFLLSGATAFLGNVFFPVEQLPEWIRPATNYVPVTWSLRVVRGALLQGKGIADLSHELLVLGALTAVLFPSALYISRVAIRKAKQDGSLVQY